MFYEAHEIVTSSESKLSNFMRFQIKILFLEFDLFENYLIQLNNHSYTFFVCTKHFLQEKSIIKGEIAPIRDSLLLFDLTQIMLN